MAFGEKISRRNVLKLVGGSAICCVPGIGALPDTPQMQDAVVKLANLRDDIRNTVITGTDIQNLPAEQLAFLRGDDKTLKALFPKLDADELATIKAVMPFEKGDGVVINNTAGLLTAYRRDPRTRLWDEAGFSPPPGIPMTQEEAFAWDKHKPVNNVRGFAI